MIAIRPLTAGDRTAAFELIATALLDEPDPASPSDETAAADFANLNADLDRHLAGDASILFLVATDGAAIVGVAATSASFLARPGVWELGWQVVRPDCRRRGLGSALLRHAADYARDHGASIMLLSSGEPGHHRQAGYRIVVQSENETVMARTLR
jgi:GNAT superfamily N-acetyltransferase